MVADLTGMEIANASLLDEATAAAEAMTMLHGSRSRDAQGKNSFFVSHECFPQTKELLKTRAHPLGIELVFGDFRTVSLDDSFYGALLQYPAADGAVHDYAGFVSRAKEKGVTIAVAADILSLVLLTPPGEWGADVVFGSTQRFGVPMGYGGPHAAYFACRDAYKRAMPGRIIGVSVDAEGSPALRMALQTREQHIRREKATSNICTAQALLAIMAGMYAAYHGPKGLRTIAQRVQRLTAMLAAGLKRLGYTPLNETFFDTLTIQTGKHTAAVHAAANRNRLNLRKIDDQHAGISLDETTTREDVRMLLSVFAEAMGKDDETGDLNELENIAPRGIPDRLTRTSAYLTHPVFNQYHSEHEMLRYLRSLADKDLALDRSMIPLGSCTMKLNATSEMLPVTWPEFGAMHPFAPMDQTAGYRAMIAQLEQMLVALTGYAAVSLQPNAGSQGEYAGLLIIKAYHASRGDGRRTVCLIPSSAHGTNPASAMMAGMRVVVVACDEYGNIDLADLRAKAEEHQRDLAAIMITYPSTHGVFEAEVRQVCEIVHQHGGQVYVDGANLNAMVGLAAPGQFGGDVSHLNLHKTFCIPHGGGGPGVGPVAVAPHLAKFLPNLRAVGYERSRDGIGGITGAPYGSASILPISWM
ncbi:MAG: glycine dehydrogenase (aminomethyl-transferring), partial [Burkholderiales bacterium 21-58-4]